MIEYTLNCKTTPQPDFGGFLYFVEPGELFDAGDYADAYKLNRAYIDEQSVKSVQNAAAQLVDGQWLQVGHEAEEIDA